MQIQKDDPTYTKMLGFVKKLLDNPNFESQSLVKREDSILKFFVKNESQLKPNFTSGDYFPNMDWNKIKALFFTVLRDYILDALIPEIERIGEYINFSVVRVIAEGPLEDYKKNIMNFYEKIITHKEVRSEFDSVETGIRHKYIKKYLEAFKMRMGYGSKELFKYRQLSDLDDFTHFLRICLILRNVMKIRIPLKVDGSLKNVTYDNVKNNPLLKREFFKKVNGLVKNQFTNLPDFFIKTSINSAIDINDSHAEIEAVNMFLKIIAERSKNAVVYQKIDKGAETPDKSWFNIARRNAGFYGFDSKLLDEFYIIASEHSW